jgi:hypothetical protein
MSRKNHDGTPIDPDNDRGYCRPRGWRDAKKALAGPAAEEMRRLEALPGCPRYALAIACHAFMALTDEQRRDAHLAYGGLKQQPRAPKTAARRRRSAEPTLPAVVPPPQAPVQGDCADPGEWEDVACYSEQCEGDLVRRMPRRRVRALARRGMVVSIMNSDESGVIEQVHRDYAMVRTEGGDLIKQTWGELELFDVGPDPSELADAWGPALGTITVGGRTWPVRLVRGRLFLEGGAAAGWVDFDSGNVLVSDLASDEQTARTVGYAFTGLMEYWIESNTKMLATWQSPPGIDETEVLPEPPDEGRIAA